MTCIPRTCIATIKEKPRSCVLTYIESLNAGILYIFGEYTDRQTDSTDCIMIWWWWWWWWWCSIVVYQSRLILSYYIGLYNFIHHQTMIANNENNKQIELINIYATLTTNVQKKVTAQPIFYSKNTTSFFSNRTEQVKMKLHTTISITVSKIYLCDLLIRSWWQAVSLDCDRMLMMQRFHPAYRRRRLVLEALRLCAI